MLGYDLPLLLHSSPERGLQQHPHISAYTLGRVKIAGWQHMPGSVYTSCPDYWQGPSNNAKVALLLAWSLMLPPSGN